MPTQPPRLILASGSRGRRYLMEQAGYTFEAIPADIDEPTEAPAGDIRRYVHELSWRKAAAVAGRIAEGVIVAADTVGWLDGRVIGKPDDRADAGRIIRAMSGRDHELWTGVTLWRRPDDLQICWQEVSQLYLRSLTDDELRAYLDHEENWRGNSGAYAIRENDPYLTLTSGSLSNVIGLPMESLARHLPRLCQRG